MSDDDDMSPDMNPEEEDAAEDDYRERLKRLGDCLRPPIQVESGPGTARKRSWSVG